TRERDGQPHRSLSGLAPDEVYRADRVTAAAGGLLPHRFTLTPDSRPRRSAFCGTVSRVAPGGCYPPSCPAEPGRSSASDRSDDAAVLPTRSRLQPTGRSRPIRAWPGPVAMRDSSDAGFLGAHQDAIALGAQQDLVGSGATH